MQALLGPWRRVLLRPVPVVHIGGIGSLFDNPTRISFTPLGHSSLDGICVSGLCEMLVDVGSLRVRSGSASGGSFRLIQNRGSLFVSRIF